MRYRYEDDENDHWDRDVRAARAARRKRIIRAVAYVGGSSAFVFWLISLVYLFVR